MKREYESSMTDPRNRRTIDRDKVRVEARKLDGTGLRIWLDRAIDRLSDDAIAEVFDGYVHLNAVLADEGIKPSLLASIQRFFQDSIAGHYYEDFLVNSHNFMDTSGGTQVFIAEHSRLVDACLRAEAAGDLETAGKGLGVLIDLMREVDRGTHDIVFFADEAGSWQVGVAWQRVLPCWFRSLTPCLEPTVWAKTVADSIKKFARGQVDSILATTYASASPEQREALAGLEDELRRRC